MRIHAHLPPVSDCQVAVVGIPAFFTPGSDAQLIVALLITFFSFGVYMQINPYNAPSVSILRMCIALRAAQQPVPLLTCNGQEAALL